jgi:hypothetical protein
MQVKSRDDPRYQKQTGDAGEHADPAGNEKPHVKAIPTSHQPEAVSQVA